MTWKRKRNEATKIKQVWLKETKMNGEQVKYNYRATKTIDVYRKIPLALLMQKVPRQRHQFFGFYKGVSSLKQNLEIKLAIKFYKNKILNKINY